MDRRHFILSCNALGASAWLPVGAAHAATAPFPTKPVRIVVPFQAGGAADVLARVFGESLSKTWNTPVVVDNKPGGGGIIASQSLVASPRDGHTLLLSVVQTILRPLMVPETPFRVPRDLAPVTRIAESHVAFVVRADAPYSTMKEFIAHARNDDKVSFGSSAAGGVVHLYAELLKKEQLPKLIIAHLRGDAQVLSDVLGGHITSGLATVSGSVNFLRDNKLKALAVTGRKRSPDLPGVPTFAEVGLPGYELGFWFGVFAGSGTPAPVLDQIQAAFAGAGGTKEVMDGLRTQRLVSELSTPAVFAAALQQEAATWAAIIQKTGVKAES